MYYLFGVGLFSSDPDSILETAVQMQNQVANAMNELWAGAINGEVYGAVATVGGLFAAITLAISLVQVTKELINDEKSFVPYERILWWAIVILLLANNGNYLGELTLSFRDLIRTTNSLILTETIDGVNLEQGFQQATQNIGLSVSFENAAENCQQEPDPELKQQCLDNLQQQMEQFENQQEVDEGFFSGLITGISSFIERLIISFMLALSVAFQWLIEITLILTALLGPLAVGMSLLPVTQKAIYTWLISFYSVGLCQLCYNLLISLLAVLQNNAPGANRLIFTVSIGLLAPILSVVLAAGAGQATFSSLAGLASLAGGKVGGGIGGVGVGLGKKAGGAILNRGKNQIRKIRRGIRR